MISPDIPQNAEAVAQHYNDLDRYYRELWGEHVHHGLWRTGKESTDEAILKLIDEVAAAAGIEPEMRVCDIGCGYGGTARRLTEKYGAQVVGLTISEAQHAYASEQSVAGNPEYRLQNWLTNDFADATFDAVVSIECLAHIEDKQAYFDQIFRVLKPGKRAGITAWLTTTRPRRWEVKHLLEPICREGRLTSMGSATEYHQLIQQAGLRCESFEDLSAQVQKTWRICAWRLARGLMKHADYRRDLFARRNRNWVFAITLWRILTAFATGSMRYGLFVLEKPSS